MARSASKNFKLLLESGETVEYAAGDQIADEHASHWYAEAHSEEVKAKKAAEGKKEPEAKKAAEGEKQPEGDDKKPE